MVNSRMTEKPLKSLKKKIKRSLMCEHSTPQPEILSVFNPFNECETGGSQKHRVWGRYLVRGYHAGIWSHDPLITSCPPKKWILEGLFFQAGAELSAQSHDLLMRVKLISVLRETLQVYNAIIRETERPLCWNWYFIWIKHHWKRSTSHMFSIPKIYTDPFGQRKFHF